MKKYLLWITGLLILLNTASGVAQVMDLSYTIAPTAEYIFRDKEAGLADGFIAGGKLGFGFGQFVELSGVYFQAIDLKTDFSRYGFGGNVHDLIPSRKVDWTRYGGELKVNLSRGTLLPFLSLGSGIQEMKLRDISSGDIINQQIYLDLGAGIVLSMADRYTLTFSGKNAQYRHNAIRGLMTEGDRQALDLDLDNFDLKRLSNWGINASLQFYIGGENPSHLTKTDKAYRQHYGSGLGAFSISLEPVGGQFKFHEKLPYRDTWYAGIQAGMNFGNYIGLSGFYWQGLEEDQARSFDDIRLYGGEARFNLNRGDGLTPFLTLGGGYLNVGDDYIPREDLLAKNQLFAMGGAGLSLSLSPYFKLFGGARAILLSDEDLDDLSQPTDVLTSWNYHFGMSLIVGKKVDKPKTIQPDEWAHDMNEQQKMYHEVVEQLKKDQQEQLDSLRNEMERLQTDLASEREQTHEEKDSIEKKGQGRIELTPDEFSSLLEVITQYGIEMKKLDVEQEKIRMNAKWLENLKDGTSSIELEGTLDSVSIEKIEKGELSIAAALLDRMMQQEREEMEERNEETSQTATVEDRSKEIDDLLKRQNELEEALYSLEQENRDKDNTIEDMDRLLRSERRDRADSERVLRSDQRRDIASSDTWIVSTDTSFLGKIRYEGMSAHAGISFGKETAGILGFRTNFGLYGSRFRFVPEAWFGLGAHSSVGFSVQGLYSVKLAETGALSRFQPYTGVGVGLHQMEAKSGLEGLFNIVVGTDLQLWEGRAFVDFTTRNFFKYNQIVLGYRFPF